VGRRARRRPLLTAAAGLVTLILVVTSTLFAVLGDTTETTTGPGVALPTSTGPGDPALAARLSDRADALRRADPLAELQLRLAAHTLDPDNTAYRSALAQLLLGPRPLGEATVTIGPVTALAFAPSGRLAVGGHNGVQEITGDPDAMTAGPPSGAADVSAVGYGADDQLVAGTGDGTHVLSAPTAPGGPAVPIHALVRLGTTGWAATTRDGRLVVWDAPTPTGPPARVLATGLGDAAPVAADPTGRYLYAPGPVGGVTVWDRSAGTIAGRLPLVGPVRDLAAAGHGLLLAAQGSTATVWDVTAPSAPRLVATLAHPTGPIATVALAPDGRTALTSGSGTTLVWQVPASGYPTVLAMLPGGEQVVAAYRGDSTVVATASDSTVQTWSVAELLVDRPGQVQPHAVLHSSLGAGEPITYAATNTTGSYVITSGAYQPATVWSTETLGQDRQLDRAGTFASPVTGAYAVGDLLKTTAVTFASPGGASAWQIVSPGISSPTGHLTDASADTAAVTPDGNTAVVVAGTTGTVYDLSLNPQPIATLSYPQPTTALTFAPQGTVLIAGHPDGSATVHTIDLNQLHADTRHLASGEHSPLDAIALSSTDTVAVGTHIDGTVSIWTISGDDHSVTLAASSGPGPHRAWLSPAGDFAIVTNRDRAVLWSLVDRSHPAVLTTLLTTPNGSVPILVSGDGSTAVQISGDALTVWTIQPVIDVVNNPDARACQLAGLGYQRWRELVPNPTFNTPCLPPLLPQLDNSTTPTPAAS
jgi:WD40 repeat protein